MADPAEPLTPEDIIESVAKAYGIYPSVAAFLRERCGQMVAAAEKRGREEGVRSAVGDLYSHGAALSEENARLRKALEKAIDVLETYEAEDNKGGSPTATLAALFLPYARAALAGKPAPNPLAEENARLREALDRWVAVYTNALQTDHERLRGLTSQRARGEETCLGFTPVYEAYLAARAALAGKPEHPGEEEK